jgi:hypothetical protein
MFGAFRRALAARGASTVVIHGDWSSRWELARMAVAQTLTAAGVGE